jgi:hypothetical protein
MKMNRTLVQLLAVALLTGFLLSCGEKTATSASTEPETSENATSEDWNMMDEFHIVMAEAFHPYKDSANLQPAKELAVDMAEVAEKWATAPLPAQVDNDAVKSKIDQLNSGTKEFQQIVQSGTDEEIGSKLNDLHDLFHEVQDAWYHAGNE